MRRAPVDSEDDNSHLLHYVDDVLGRCEVCRASGQALQAPIARTSTVSRFQETLQVNLRVSG